MYLAYIYSFFFSFFFSLVVIFISKRLLSSLIQPIRKNGPKGHLVKQGTPSMGGVSVFISFTFLVVSFLFLKDIDINFIITLLVASGLMFLLGLWDDILKVMQKSHHGLSEGLRLLIEFVIGVTIAVLFHTPEKHMPFFSIVSMPYYVSIVLTAIIFVAIVNAFNFTDGLDGLLSWQVVAISLGLLCIVSYKFQLDSNISFVLIILIAIALAFLTFNSYPASIFMGDCGSLFFGSVVAVLIIYLGLELYTPLICIIPTLEASSVFMQRYYFKWTRKKYGTGKRLFKMAPLHHHFEQCNMHEVKIVYLFFIIAIIGSFVAFLV